MESEDKKEELIEEIDWNGNVIKIHNKSALKQNMFAHKVSVIIPKGNFDKVVLCRRAKEQFPFPDTWCCAVGGKVIAGESATDAAIREMKEEIGVELEIEKVIEVKYDNSDYKAIFHVFTTKNPVNHDNFNPNPAEIQYTKEFSIDEIIEMIEKNPEDFAPTFIKILKEFAKMRNKEQNMKKITDFEKIFEFLHTIGNLKNTFRWSETKEMPKDSSADHSWRLALMTFLIADELKLNVDKLRSVKIAIVHDIAESITGDVDYRKIADGRVLKQDKQKLELEAIHKLRDMLPGEMGLEFFSLWEEYENGETREAKFIKALDKIETLTHLMEVGHIYFKKRADIIPHYGKKQIENFPELAEMMKFVREKLKEDFKKGGIAWEE